MGRRKTRLAQVADAIGGLTVATDVSDALSLADAPDAAHGHFGPVDRVVAAAGVLKAVINAATSRTTGSGAARPAAGQSATTPRHTKGRNVVERVRRTHRPVAA